MALAGYCDINNFIFSRKQPTLELTGFKAQHDSLTDILHCLVPCPSLTNAAGDERALCHGPTILSRTEDDRQALRSGYHNSSITFKGVLSRAQSCPLQENPTRTDGFMLNSPHNKGV